MLSALVTTTDIKHKLFDALLSINRFAATRLLTVETASWTPMERIEKLIVPVLKRIGEEWEQGRIALSQVYMSGRICEDVVETILPPDAPGQKDHPTIAVVTLLDHHGLGKRIVSSVLHSAGFKLVDLGQGIPVDEIVDKVKREGVRILLVSTLMLQSALQVKDLKDRLNREGLSIRIIVGGAPFLFDPGLWKEVGADAMAGTASEAISLIARMEKKAAAA
jgi:methanogenic corrinoid protein MtbC1